MDSKSSRPRTPTRPGMQGNIPRTPPYTPIFSTRRFHRDDSPVPSNSTHNIESSSPAKKVARPSAEDNVKVEELTEADAGYIADVDIVYPEELEEAESDINNEQQSSGSSGENSDTGITGHFSRLDCEDGAEAEFEKKRRAKHVRRRTNSRVFKRSHSQSINDDTEMTDSDAMGDQDRSSSARRLRRRTREDGVKVVYGDASTGSPLSRRQGVEGELGERWQDHSSNGDDPRNDEAMDVDAAI